MPRCSTLALAHEASRVINRFRDSTRPPCPTIVDRRGGQSAGGGDDYLHSRRIGDRKQRRVLRLSRGSQLRRGSFSLGLRPHDEKHSKQPGGQVQERHGIGTVILPRYQV